MINVILFVSVILIKVIKVELLILFFVIIFFVIIIEGVGEVTMVNVGEFGGCDLLS
jgi:hypothetical protein